MFNSAKNKYDSDDELEENKQMKKEGSNGKILNEENISLSRTDICETGVTSMMNSRDIRQAIIHMIYMDFWDQGISLI